ncbi:uncharacterized protein LOC141590179 [Silene latifolia]|uniref:uncharacterized protein LOC141590179 n=1 Tax=Silene latifolia TaxID=37657 RepID=UPI003D7700D4
MVLKRAPVVESESDREMSSEEENEFLDAVSEEDEELGASDGSYGEGSGSESGEGESSGEDEEEDDDGNDEDEDGDGDGDGDGDEDEDEDEDGEGREFVIPKDDEMEELEKEYRDLQNREDSIVMQIVGGLLYSRPSFRALWDKALEIRIVLQNPYTKSNKLPQEPIRSLFLESNKAVSSGYSDLIASSKNAIDSLVQLQELAISTMQLIDNNPSIARAFEEGGPQSSLVSNGELEKMDVDQEWLQISQIQSRLASFRNKSVDKWQRKADVHSGAAAKKAKLLAFNQNISDQVETYMRDPSKMIRGMQMRRETADVFGSAAQQVDSAIEEANPEGDPELLDDSELYHQMLNEFLESVNNTSSEATFYALKNKQPKKRKVVDRRASKSRKIRYNVHEKIVNFMAPRPKDMPEMAPKLFQNLFGLRTRNRHHRIE